MMGKKKKRENKVVVNGDKITIPDAKLVAIKGNHITVWWWDGSWTEVEKPKSISGKIAYENPIPNPDYYRQVKPIRPYRYDITLTGDQLRFLKSIMKPMGNYLGSTPMGISTQLDVAVLR